MLGGLAFLPHHSFALLLKVSLLSLLALGVCREAFLVWADRVPRTRLVVPSIVLLFAVLTATGLASRPTAIAAIGVIDIVLLAVLWNAVRTSNAAFPVCQEIALTKSFERFFPRALARVAGVELTLLRESFKGIGLFVRGVKPGPYTYVAGAKLQVLVLALPLALLPDVVLVHLIVPRNLVWMEVVLDVLGVYACVWVLGLYATMVQREHQVNSRYATFHRGILGRAFLRLDDISTVEALEIQKGFRSRGRMGAGYLGVGGVGAVRIELRQGRTAKCFSIGADSAVDVPCLVVPTDHPHTLTTELLAIASRSPSRIRRRLANVRSDFRRIATMSSPTRPASAATVAMMFHGAPGRRRSPGSWAAAWRRGPSEPV